jgi:hypothetical protein
MGTIGKMHAPNMHKFIATKTVTSDGKVPNEQAANATDAKHVALKVN